MSPTVYALLEPIAFMVPVDPGPSAIYTPFAPPATIKMIDATFERSKNYFLSYRNIYRACFRMLDELVPPSFKVSNQPAHLGWNTTMSIETIMSQIESLYGKPSPAMLYSNDTVFKGPIAATDSPEALFYRMEQCQEVMMLGNLPYTTEQIIANAVCVLMALKMFPTRDFETWEAITPKTYPALKNFFHEAYNRRLNAINLQNTSGGMGYAPAQNMYNVLDYGNDDDSTADGSMVMAVQPPGATTVTASTLGNATSMASGAAHLGLIAAINQSIAPAFYQVVQNQSILQQQLAALSIAPPPPPTFAPHPVQQVAFPMKQPFPPTTPQYPGYGRGTAQQAPHRIMRDKGYTLAAKAVVVVKAAIANAARHSRRCSDLTPGGSRAVRVCLPPPTPSGDRALLPQSRLFRWAMCRPRSSGSQTGMRVSRAGLTSRTATSQ